MTQGDDGREEARQTDARTRDELEADRETTLLVALARVCAVPASFARVHCHFMHRPPHELLSALRLAGAVVHVGNDELTAVVADPGVSGVDDVVDAAMRRLAQRLCAGYPDAAAALRALEDETLAHPLEEGPERVARAVALAALAGAGIGGRWRVDARSGQLPFVVDIGDGAAHVASKALRFLARGDGERPSRLLAALASRQDEGEGVACVVLKPARWSGAIAVARPLFAAPPGVADAVPWLVAAVDRPSSLAFQKRAAVDDVDGAIDAHLAAFCATAVEVDVREESGVVVVDGHAFAAERIVDVAFMRTMHPRLGAEVVFAAVPVRGLLLVSAGTGESLAGFVGLAEAMFAEAAEQGEEISPCVFALHDGRIEGVVASTTDAAPG